MCPALGVGRKISRACYLTRAAEKSEHCSVRDLVLKSVGEKWLKKPPGIIVVSMTTHIL